jgi:crotonobetainyl-CoA:carnitine CoA-transferase CaiB-like acyl-CoA transferase
MADMGAKVLKVEPLGGDGMRGKLRQPSPAHGFEDADIPFHLDNRGKRSIAVNLADPEGAALVRELAARAQVVVTNMLPARLARFGLGPDELRAADPSLVYAVVTGFGSEGPEANRNGFDLTAFFARGGVMSLMGEPGEAPPAFRPGQGDHPTGLALLAAVLAALRVRDRTGEGQVVEAALLRTALWTIGCDVSAALVDRSQPTKRARNEPFSPMNTRYVCSDGAWINLSSNDQTQWAGFCHAVGRPDLAEDERFATPVDRFQNGPEIVAILDALFGAEPYAHWAERLDRSGVVWAKIAELPEVVDDHQARANHMFTEVHHPTGGTFETLAAPFTLSGSDVEARGPAPALGEHTAEVLRELGIDPARAAALAASGVVGGLAPG